MKKIEAITALTSGQVSEIVSPDGKGKFLMVNGSIVTSRKKVLDMKDMMEDGWEVKKALDWRDYVGGGILVSVNNILTLAMSDDNGSIMDTNGKEISADATTITLEEVKQFIWDEAAIEKRLEKEAKKAIKDAKQVKEDEETTEEVTEEPTPQAPVAEKQTTLPSEEELVQAAGTPVGKSQKQTEKPTALPREEVGDFVIDSAVIQRKRYFISLGLPEDEWENFVSRHGLTADNIEDFTSKDVSEIVTIIKESIGA